MADKKIKLVVDDSDVKDATKSVEQFNKSVNDTLDNTGALDTKVGGMWKSFKAGSDIAVKGLTSVKGAIAATGIGLLIIAVQALVNYFKNTEEGANKLKEMMAALGIIIRDGPIVVIKALKVAFEAWMIPFKTGISVITNFIKVLTGKASLSEAVDNVTDSFKKNIEKIKEDVIEIGKSTKALVDRAKVAAEIAKREAEIRKGDREDLLTFQKLQNEIAALREKASEEGVTATKKQELFNKAIEKENLLFKLKKEDLAEELQIVKDKIANGDKTGEMLDELAQKEGELMSLEEDHSKQMRGLNRQDQAASKQIASEKKKEREEEEKAKAEDLKLLRKYQEEAALAKVSGQEQDLLKLQQWHEDELTANGKNADLKLAIDESYEAKKAEIIKKYADKAIEDKEKADEEAQKILDKKTEDYEAAQEELSSWDVDNYITSQKKKQKFLEDSLKKGLISEKQYNTGIKGLKDLERQYQMSASADTLDMVSEAAGKGTKVGKAAGVASTTIKTFQAAMGAYSSLIDIPIVGPILAPIAAAAAVVIGMKNIASIIAVKEPEKQKMEYGGFVTGPSHLNGGTNINAQGGELMMTTNAVSRNPQVASMVMNANSAALSGGNAKTLSETDVALIAASVVKAIPVNINETDRNIEQRRITVRENSFTV